MSTNSTARAIISHNAQINVIKLPGKVESRESN